MQTFHREIEDHQLIQYYLMSSYLYYQKDISLLTDNEYDNVCKRLDKKWDNINHPHKYLIDRGSLSATTGFTIKYYPLSVQSAAFNCYDRRNKHNE